MNKIFLKKSFANYPVGEYVLGGDYYCMPKQPQLPGLQKYFQIHKDIVEGMKDHFEEVKERPTSWEELGELNGYWVNEGSEVNVASYCNSSDEEQRNIFKTEQQAEASIALAQITQLLDKYDIPESSNVWYHHDGYDYYRRGLLGFDTQEKRDHFYKHHADLISKLAPFYIF